MTKALLRSEIVARVAEEAHGLSVSEAERIVDVFFDGITDHLAKGGRVELRDFGVFSTRARDARTGRNPRTGAIVEVTAKHALHFKAGKDMRARIDGPRADPLDDHTRTD